MRRSIRVRLLVWVLALVVPLSVFAGWLLVEAFGNRLLHDFDVALQEEAETIAELLTARASPEAIANLVAEIAGEGDRGANKYIVVTRQGRVIAQAPRTALEVLRSPDPEQRVVRYDSADHSITVSIAASAAAAMHAKQRLTSLLLVGIPAMLALLAASLWGLIGRALRPLENASRHLDQIAADNLAVRVPIDNPDDEVGRMVTVLNRMLDRLARAVSELQQFTADAAHELRTPVTVLRAGLEVAMGRERSAAEYRAALAEALASTERLARLADDLLTLTRLDAAAAPRAVELVDLSDVLHELADASAERAAQQQVTIDVSAPSGLWVAGNAGDLYRLFNNLIDNALRHGTNGTPGEIALSAQREAEQIHVSVADTGPGIAPQDLSRICDRFYRGQGNRADAAGAGLGLSIAQEIARTHGGQIAAANREGGGCVVTVSLPAAVCSATTS
ncbi:MAG: HAMP domain-containing sensor histidine kinase [Candidatus Binatia bacterium]